MTLEQLVIQTAARTPEATAIVSGGSATSYGQLDAWANQLARSLRTQGVTKADRVGIWADKSAHAIAAMQAVLRLGAAYVPLDPTSPTARTAAIARDCQMRAVVTTGQRAKALAPLVPELGLLCLDESETGVPWSEVASQSCEPLESPENSEDDLAYILYTSGSTGSPKGVCLSHQNALAFIRWAADVLRAVPADHFANHAPFFFDLSVLDLYVPFLVGARVCLIPETMSFAPTALVEFISRERITVWYSVPSALTLMMERGRLMELQDHALRAFLFAGEPFPIKPLRELWQRFRDARFLNLYGPTETNVCTWHEVSDIPADRLEPLPIGRPSCGDRIHISPLADDPGTGELLVEGPTVMLGYWGQPRHLGAYRTGDRVRLDGEGNLVYLGRLDDMVKVRGRRVEPGEIETALAAHSNVDQVAVVAAGSGMEARLVAFAVASGDKRPGLLELKRHCADRLPRYMIIDQIVWVDALPRSRTGKVDRKTLRSRAECQAPEQT